MLVDYFMQRALELAKLGKYSCRPNPAVGCVLVKDNKIVSEGYHSRCGLEHAEVVAINNAGKQAEGSTCYVTLEPCSHFGRTPPCADALIKAGIAKVVIAMQDPNPKVYDKGIQKLIDSGIEVVVGSMQKESLNLNKGFISRMQRKRPFVRAKVATSLDGKIALSSGLSKWITSNEAREDVQIMRAKHCAILTGVNTVLKDNSKLNVRSIAAKELFVNSEIVQPIRFILDTQGKLNKDLDIFKYKGLVVILTTSNKLKLESFTDLAADVKIFLCSGEIDKVTNKKVISSKEILSAMQEFEVNELLVESGPTLLGYMLRTKLIDELVFYQAPKLLGSEAISIAELGKIEKLDDSIELKFLDSKAVGKDLKLVAEVI